MANCSIVGSSPEKFSYSSDLISRLDLGLGELRRVVQQCGEKLVIELRRRGQYVWQLYQDKPVIRELLILIVLELSALALKSRLDIQIFNCRREY